MPFRNPFKRNNKESESDPQVESANQRRQSRQEQPPYYDASATNEENPVASEQKQALSSATPDVKDPQQLSQDPLPHPEQTLPAYSSSSTQSSAQPPKYNPLRPDPHDPYGVPYGYEYRHHEQNFPHPSSVYKDIGKEMTYNDPKAAELARKASTSGREDLTEMMNYYLRQQQLGKKSTDNGIAAWMGV